MKNMIRFFLLFLVIVFVSCKTDKQEQTIVEPNPSKKIEELAPLPTKADTVKSEAPKKLDLAIPEKKTEKILKKK
jgi:hypothetical protein